MRAVDHYREAERLVQCANDSDAETADEELRYAAVHATLALAGATALQAYSDGTEDELLEWQAAAGGEE